MIRESNPQKSWSRRDWLRWCGQGMAAAPLASLLACSKDRVQTMHTPGGARYQGTDEQLLEEIQRASFQFFWEQANPDAGQVKDRAFLNGSDTRTMSSIAATGFGLTALCIGDTRGYGKKQEIAGRRASHTAVCLGETARGSRLLLSLCGYEHGPALGPV